MPSTTGFGGISRETGSADVPKVHQHASFGTTAKEASAGAEGRLAGTWPELLACGLAGPMLRHTLVTTMLVEGRPRSESKPFGQLSQAAQSQDSPGRFAARQCGAR
jgi:hypothetical protein